MHLSKKTFTCFTIYILFTLIVNLQSREANTQFSVIDQNADKAPEYLKKSLPDLVNYLVRPAKNNIQKVRAIFRWISQNISYDMNAFFDQRLIEEKPEKVIKQGKAVCGGYSRLFKHMCDIAGIKNEIVTGWSKGYGEQLSGRPNHAWNAVKIKLRWYLLDVTWGSGYINSQGKYIKYFQDHYFLTDPKQMIYDHFPEDEYWQQLSKPLSRKQFKDLIFLRPAFFKTGLSLVDYKESTIEVTDTLIVSISAPLNTYISAQLIHKDQTLNDNYVFIQRLDDKYSIYVHFPEKNNYILRIFSKEGQLEKKYNWACDYNIHVLNRINDYPFTKQYATFFDLNCYIYQPLDFYLNSDKNQRFKIRVKNATEVALLMNNKVYPFKKAMDIYTLNMPLQPGPVHIIARTDMTNHYQFLLDYKVE